MEHLHTLYTLYTFDTIADTPVTIKSSQKELSKGAPPPGVERENPCCRDMGGLTLLKHNLALCQSAGKA